MDIWLHRTAGRSILSLCPRMVCPSFCSRAFALSSGCDAGAPQLRLQVLRLPHASSDVLLLRRELRRVLIAVAEVGTDLVAQPRLVPRQLINSLPVPRNVGAWIVVVVTKHPPPASVRAGYFGAVEVVDGVIVDVPDVLL